MYKRSWGKSIPSSDDSLHNALCQEGAVKVQDYKKKPMSRHGSEASMYKVT